MITLNCLEATPVEVKNEKLMFKLIRASFNQRRKTLQNGLTNSSELPFSKEEVGQAIQAAGLPAAIRGEKLGLSEFAALANYFEEMNKVNKAYILFFYHRMGKKRRSICVRKNKSMAPWGSYAVWWSAWPAVDRRHLPKRKERAKHWNIQWFRQKMCQIH